MQDKEWLTPTEAKNYCEQEGGITKHNFYKLGISQYKQDGQYYKPTLDIVIKKREEQAMNKINKKH